MRATRLLSEEIANQLGLPWKEIEAQLFGDVYDLHRLRKFDGYPSGTALMTRYNEAQLQAVLYHALSMAIRAHGDYKHIVRVAKLNGLLLTATRAEDGFLFTFAGPASLLRETARYGVDMSRMIPTLLACTDWELDATIRRFPDGRRQPKLMVSSTDKYLSSQAVANRSKAKLFWIR